MKSLIAISLTRFWAEGSGYVKNSIAERISDALRRFQTRCYQAGTLKKHANVNSMKPSVKRKRKSETLVSTKILVK